MNIAIRVVVDDIVSWYMSLQLVLVAKVIQGTRTITEISRVFEH